MRIHNSHAPQNDTFFVAGMMNIITVVTYMSIILQFLIHAVVIDFNTDTNAAFWRYFSLPGCLSPSVTLSACVVPPVVPDVVSVADVWSPGATAGGTLSAASVVTSRLSVVLGASGAGWGSRARLTSPAKSADTPTPCTQHDKPRTPSKLRVYLMRI